MQPDNFSVIADNRAKECTDPHTWVSNYADYLYAYAITRVNDHDTARDLVQDTFLAALEKVNLFEARSTERTWLTSILKNKIVDCYRKKSSGLQKLPDVVRAEQEQYDFFDADDGHWNPAHRPQEFTAQPTDPLNDKEFAGILHTCMQKLPVLWLSVFTMKHMDDELTDHICTELRLTQANFWVIMHRTKLNLRNCLQKNWI